MGRIRFLELADIIRMLESCAQGHTRRQGTHRLIVHYGRGCHHLPHGPHGKQDPPIGYNHVRAMVEHLKIPAHCVNGHFEGMVAA